MLNKADSMDCSIGMLFTSQLILGHLPKISTISLVLDKWSIALLSEKQQASHPGHFSNKAAITTTTVQQPLLPSL